MKSGQIGAAMRTTVDRREEREQRGAAARRRARTCRGNAERLLGAEGSPPLRPPPVRLFPGPGPVPAKLPRFATMRS